MGFFGSLFSSVQSGIAKAQEEQFITQCREMNKATPEHLENIIKLKKLDNFVSRIAIIWLYQKSGWYRTSDCLAKNGISVEDAKQSVKRLLGINTILLSSDRLISTMREAGTRLLDEI